MSHVIWLLPFPFGRLSWPIRSHFWEAFLLFLFLFFFFSVLLFLFVVLFPLLLVISFLLPLIFLHTPFSITREHLHVTKIAVPPPEIHRDLGSQRKGEKTEQVSAYKALSHLLQPFWQHYLRCDINTVPPSASTIAEEPGPSNSQMWSLFCCAGGWHQ